MNDVLAHYETNSKVYCINGMSLGSQVTDSEAIDTNLLSRNASHDWATWADRWRKAIWDPATHGFEILDLRNQLRRNRGGNDMTHMLRLQFNGRIDTRDIQWSYTISKNDGVCLTPRCSYVTHQTSSEGTNLKTYIPAFDHHLALANKSPRYPDTTEIDPVLGRKFATF